HGFHLVEGGSATGARNQADARIGDLLGIQTGISDCLLHGQVGEGCGITHETQYLAVDEFFQVELDRAGNLTAHADFGIGRVETDAGTASPQAVSHRLLVGAQAGNDAQTGDHDATHGGNPLETVGGGEQADSQTFGAVYLATIDADAAIGDGQDQGAVDGALDMNVVGELLGGRQHLTEELHFTGAQRPAAARVALPAEEEAYQLPHGIQAQTAGHYRITFEMAAEEPQIRMDVEFSDDLAL